MKKIVFYTLLCAISMITASCGKDVTEPPIWSPGEVITLPGFSASAVATIDLAAADSVVAFTYTSPTSIPEGSTIANFRLAITPDGIVGATEVNINASLNGKVASADLQKIIENSYGKRPIERFLKTKVYANLIKEGQVCLLTCDPIVIKATSKTPFISSAYYLVGDMLGWDAAGMAKFAHSDEDVYEDPIFTLVFTTTKADQCWKIVPQENVDADAAGVENGFWQEGAVGVEKDGDTSMSGKLINSGDVKAGKIEKPGMYSITLNMMDYTYTIKEVVPEYYIVGSMQGWEPDIVKGKTCILYQQSKMIYSYTTAFKYDANLKIWPGNDFGDWIACLGSVIDGDNSVSGSIVGDDDVSYVGAIVCPEKGAYYTFKADFSAMTYTWTKLNTQSPTAYEVVSLIGAFNDWKQETNIDLVEKTPHNWYGAAIVLTAGELKFCANNALDINWGTLDKGFNVGDQKYGTTITKNGNNMNVPAGTYNVYFNDITGDFAFILVE